MEIRFQEQEPKRIDRYLVEQNIEALHSRTYIDALIADHHVLVNKQSIKKSHLLRYGDIISIIIPPSPEPALLPQNIPLQIIYEDEKLLVVNKQAGLTVHPAPGNPDGTLVNALVHYLGGDLAAGFDRLRPGIVHRLDKDTSGLLIVAKDDRIHKEISTMFQSRRIGKFYKAVTLGSPVPQEGVIETLVRRSDRERQKMMVAKSGRQAVTHYRVEEDFTYFSLLDIRLETGRTHQIRLHLSHINCPVLGDNTYSGLKRVLSQIPAEYHRKLKHLLSKHLLRQALHAYRLEFLHPFTGRELILETPLPEDMQYTLQWLRNNFSEDI